jgi:hypothetical protein
MTLSAWPLTLFSLGFLLWLPMAACLEAVSAGKINNSFIFSFLLSLTWCYIDILANVQLLNKHNLATMIFWTLMTLMNIVAFSALLVCIALFGSDDFFFGDNDYMYIVRSCKVAFTRLIVFNKIMALVIVYKDYKKGRRDVKITVKV